MAGFNNFFRYEDELVAVYLCGVEGAEREGPLRKLGVVHCLCPERNLNPQGA
jgi:hypothetical protein